MKYGELNEVELESSGKRMDVPYRRFSLTTKSDILCGGDGYGLTYPIDNDQEVWTDNRQPVLPEERKEIAEEMIKRWQKWADKSSPVVE